MAHVVGGAEAHGQHIGDAGALTELLGAQGFEGEVGGEGVAEGRGANQVEVGGGRAGRSGFFARGLQRGFHLRGQRAAQAGQIVREYWFCLALVRRLPGHVVGGAFGVLGQRQQRVPGLAQVLPGLVLPIKSPHPGRQLRQVKGAADEGAVAAVVPISGRSRVASRQNRAPVLHAQPDDLALEVGGQPQLVANSGREHITRRLLPGHLAAAHGPHGLIFGDVGGLARLAHKPVVAHDAVDARRGAGVDAGVARPGVGGHEVVVRRLVAEALAQQPLEAVRPVLVPVAVQKVIAHLVHYDADHQLRTGQRGGRFLGLGRPGQQGRQQG